MLGLGTIRGPVAIVRDGDQLWSVIPTALWEVDFSRAVRWIRRLGCKDGRSLKLFLRSHPEAADQCLGRVIIRHVSAGAAELFGAPSVEECKQHPGRFFTAESRADFIRVMIAALRNQTDLRFETTVLRFDGQLMDVKVHWRFFDAPEQPHRRAYVHIEDATEEYNLHQRVLLADRMSALGSLTASVAHEIRNPLTFVRHHLDELRSSDELSLETRTRLQEAYDGVERVRDLVKDLGELSGSAQEDLDIVDVHEVLDYAIRLSRPEFQHRAGVVRDYKAKRAHIRAARSSVAQVFVNLMVNAAQSIPPGDGSRHRIAIRTHTQAGDHTVIEIEDTGAGVPSELIDRVFDPFLTDKPGTGGRGMGLPICARVVDSLGGTIDLESGPAGGTLVRVILPQAVPRRYRSTPPSFKTAIRPVPGKRLRILVADDEIVIGRLLMKLLGKQHDVDYRQSGREAILALSQADYDVILCDLIMPDMTGMDVYRAARMRAKPIHDRIVFMSGGAFTRDAREFLERVPNLRIDKPFDLSTVEELVGAAAALAASAELDSDHGTPHQSEAG